MWDPEADALLASVLDRGDVPAVNAALRTWKKDGQPLPDGLPRTCATSLSGAAAAVLGGPRQARDVVRGLASGMISAVIPHEARAVY